MYAPILVFAYKRPAHLNSCLESLESNNLALNSELFIFIDGPKTEAEQDLVRQCYEIANKEWKFAKCHIYDSEINLGLVKSIRSGVSKVLSKHSAAIIVEDDLVVHKSFLSFMNDSLKRYELEPNVASVQGFSMINRDSNECYFLKGADCWGWATWNDRWNSVEWDSPKLLQKIVKSQRIAEFNYSNSYNFLKLLEMSAKGQLDSWAIEWQASMFIQNRVSVYPPCNLVQNIGTGSSATHLSQDLSQFPVAQGEVNWKYLEQITVENRIFKEVADKYLEYYPRPVLVSKAFRIAKKVRSFVKP
jgi:hypothetical protein